MHWFFMDEGENSQRIFLERRGDREKILRGEEGTEKKKRDTEKL